MESKFGVGLIWACMVAYKFAYLSSSSFFSKAPGNICFAYEPPHEISNNVVCATSKASDQPAHMRSLIRAFACHLNIL